MTTVLEIILSLYCILLLAFLFGWVRTRRQSMPARDKSTPGISVVVAVRNEERNIQSLMQSLSAIVYPSHKFEVIIVNDHSTDGTSSVTREAIRNLANVRVIELPEGIAGKKAALQLGVKESSFDIIATTDADCLFSKHWLECLAPYFALEPIKMIVGAVKLKRDSSFFSRLQVTEFISLVGSTAATIGLGHPVMCNGANLAFRKNVFSEVGGYDGNIQVASGDDEFLMRKIYARYPSGIQFLNYYEAVVSTQPQRTVKEFFHQRLRWAGKWRYNSDLLARLLAVFIFVSHIAFLLLLIKNIYHPDESLALVINKLFLEGVFLFWVGRFLDRRFDVLAFLTLQILYPLYITVVGVFSFKMTYLWKGRNYK